MIIPEPRHFSGQLDPLLFFFTKQSGFGAAKEFDNPPTDMNDWQRAGFNKFLQDMEREPDEIGDEGVEGPPEDCTAHI